MKIDLTMMLIWPNFSGPLVAILTGFHCNCISTAKNETYTCSLPLLRKFGAGPWNICTVKFKKKIMINFIINIIWFDQIQQENELRKSKNNH